MTHVIVTGGSRGLGQAFVKGLLAESERANDGDWTATEYCVSLCSRGYKAPEYINDLKHQYGEQFIKQSLFWMRCEIGNPEETENFINAAVSHFGGVYGLINNAGVAQAGILASFPNVESEKILKTNLLGPIQAARAVSNHLIKQNRGGRIVNISSIIGSRGYNGMSVYSASKAGLDGFTRALARELGRKNITVNSVAPGYVQTDMSAGLNTGQLAQIVNRTPLGRLATEDDVWGAVKFLLSKDANMITGQTILVDGGISC